MGGNREFEVQGVFIHYRWRIVSELRSPSWLSQVTAQWVIIVNLKFRMVHIMDGIYSMYIVGALLMAHW